MAEETLAAADGGVSITQPVSLLRHLRYVLKAMRPRQWSKNGIVFMALIFSVNQDWLPEDFDTWDHLLLRAFITALCFCAVSGAEYMVNDLKDRESDRMHPTKRRRPIAAGLVGPREALTWAAFFASAGIVVAALVDWRTGAVLAGYFALMLAYTAVLKYEVILDVMTIAGLFVLRVLAGALAVDADASAYLLLCTGMVALFLGFTKRRQEATSELHSGTESRPVLEHYSIPFLDQMVAMVTAATVMSYAIYCVNSPLIGSKMLGTLPPVVYGIFRYLDLVYDRKDTRSTDAILLSDYGMIGAAIAWVASAVILLAIFN